MKKKFRGEHSQNTSSILRTIASATASVSVGQAVVSDGYYVILANSTNLATTLTHAGIATSAGTAGTEISIIHHGLVDPTIFNLGAGVACAVGTDSGGNVVRVTSGSLSSGLKYLGNCDVNGTITILPKKAENFNVKDFGAIGDGSTDDTTAIQSAIGTTSNIYYFPASTYKINSTVNIVGTNIILQGDGIDNTIISAGTSSMTMLSSSTTSANITIEDLTINYNTLGFLIFIMGGNSFTSINFRRVKFTGTAEANITYFTTGGNNIVYEDCIFDGRGQANANAIVMLGSCQNITVSGCIFRGLLDGISLQPGTNNTAIDNVLIENSYFDFMYYSMPALPGYSNSGGTVTYTSSTLVDTSKTFTVNAYGTIRSVNQYGYIRSLISAGTGTITTNNATQLIDTSGTFLTSGLGPGDMIKTSSSYAVIKSIDSNTVINIEEWLDSTTATPINYTTGSYTIYKVILGKISSGSSHTITLYNGWADLYGNVQTPTNGSLYEIVPQPNYPISCQVTAEKVRIINNVFKRSYTDQVSSFGNNCEVSSNTIMDGQDVGITIDGTTDGYGGRHLVHDNKIFRQGSLGIFIGQGNCDIHDNQIIGFGTRENLLGGGSGIACNPAGTSIMNGGQIHNNFMDGYGTPFAYYGIALEYITGMHILDNQIYNIQDYEIIISGSTTQNNFIRHTTDSISYGATGGIPPGNLLEINGSNFPLGSLPASPGSIYKDTTNGILWLKTFGTDSNNWQLMETEAWTPENIPDLAAWYRADFIFSSTKAPDQISGLSAWYRADKGIILGGSSVTTWADQSGNGYDLTQATGANKPTYTASDNNYNGHPSITGTSTQWLYNGSIAIAQPTTVIIIGNSNAGSGSNFIAAGSSNGFYIGRDNSTSSSYTNNGNTMTNSVSGYGSPSVIIAAINGSGAGNFYTSSSTATTTTGLTNAINGFDLLTSDNHNDGGNTVVEAAIFNRQLSATEIQEIINYAAQRYGITSFVNAWSDNSGTGDTNKNLVQSVQAAQPTLTVIDSSYNNQPTISFVSTSSQLLKSPQWTNNLPLPQTIFLVYNQDATFSEQGYVDGLFGSGDTLLVFGVGGTIHAYAGTSLDSTTAVSSVPTILCVVFNGTSSSIYVSKKTPVTGSTGTTTVVRGGVTLGADGGGAVFLNGTIAEHIIFGRVLSQTEINQTLQYLSARYAITVEN